MKTLKKLTYLFLLVLPIAFCIGSLLDGSSYWTKFICGTIGVAAYLTILDLLDDRGNAK